MMTDTMHVQHAEKSLGKMQTCVDTQHAITLNFVMCTTLHLF